MRRMTSSLLGLLVPIALVAQTPDSTAPRPASVTKGQITVICRNGATAAKPVGVGLTFGRDPVTAARLVPRAISAAGFELLSSIPATYNTRARLTWPDTTAADSFRLYAYPGVVATLVLGRTRTDSIAVIGMVEALCSSNPGAPDSTVAVALRIAAAQLQQSLEALRPRR